MALLAFGDFRPDVSDYEGQATRNIQNVIPRGDGYGPFPSFTAALNHSMGRRRRYGATARDVWVYRCKFCCAFHVGHRPRSRR